MLTLNYGDIVLVDSLLDPQGRNPKNRPVVVLNNPDGDGSRRIRVVAVTTLVPAPLPEDHVLLPWAIPRHPRTGLNKRCAAVCSWLALVDRERAIRHVGIVPLQPLTQIALIVERLTGETR